MTTPIVRVCWARLGDLDARAAWLSNDEVARADAFLTEVGARRFRARRGWLRRQLGLWLGVAPERLRFVRDAFGKPAIAGSRMAFSVSSSQEMVLLAFGPVATVGCDVEYCDPAFDFAPVIERFFSEAERDGLRRLPPATAAAAFWRVWTCKEAYVKAIGRGLSIALDSFDVALDSRGAARFVRGEPGYLGTSFGVESAFQAAVVAPGAWRLLPTCREADERPLS